jgi:Spy/CpxP family protein refolding chaperone
MTYALPAGAGAPCDAPQDRPKAASDSSKGRPEQRERWKWWLYDRAELGITDQQSATIDQIFESTIAQLREARRQLLRAEAELSKMIKERTADVAAVSLQVDLVERARAEHNKTRVLTLYRMHQVLSADQLVKLEALRARNEAARRRDNDPNRKR